MKYVLFIGMLLLLIYGCGGENITQAEEPLPPPRTQVTVTDLRTITMTDMLNLNAVTTYTEQTNIRATATGYIDEVDLKQGDEVDARQRAFVLKTKEAEALGDSLLSDPSLGITGLIPIVVRHAGVVTQVFFQGGDYVTDGDVLAEITKPSSLAIKVYVPFEYLRLLVRVPRIEVVLPDGDRLPATVYKALPSEDPVSQTTPYLLSLRRYRFLPQNLNVVVRLPLAVSNDALAAPVDAVQSNEEQTEFWVMQVIDDSTAVRRTVQPGIRNDTLIELKNSGLVSEDRIVWKGAYGLPDTARIKIGTNL